MTTKRKLIEVALPLEAINTASQHEKSVPRRGHPATLHLWWARRPLAACRAVLFAQLVDDPSACPDLYPTEADQAIKRKELFDLIEQLVLWENTNDEELFARAYAEILASTDGKPPTILDPFAGGGSIPLEAQRLGLDVHASDLNPVAVLINKALIEIPPRWAGRPPVFPGAAESRLGEWSRATGLAEDVRRFGTWMCDEAERRIGNHYPKATLPDGTKANVIAWIWARTVTCPNPACRAEIPLVSTWWLSKKTDRPAWIQSIVEGKKIRFEIRVDKAGPPDPPKRGRGAKFTCLVCGDTTTDAYVKSEATGGRMGARLITIVAEGIRQRSYLPPTSEHISAAELSRPGDVPEELMPDNPRWFSPPAFGLTTFADLFTNRQLVTLTTYSDLVAEARDRVEKDATAAGLAGCDATDYADAVALYLAFALSKLADWSSSVVGWINTAEKVRDTFARQAIPMTWDFAEINPLSGTVGTMSNHMEWVARSLDGVPASIPETVTQADAAAIDDKGAAVCTDPPYYDNIGYAGLSDYFYVWLRRSLGSAYADVTGTMLTPKLEELVATPYRFDGSKARADEHFERGFVRSFTRIRTLQALGVPMTMFYAFRQSETDEGGTASTGWETMLNGLIESGLSITATWPMRTERTGRSIGIRTNALASSIVLACRAREATAQSTTRRGFLAALKVELPASLREMQQGSIAPVDLAQSAIGPGMAIFTRYAKVVEADGSDMTVRTALALINQTLDEVLSEQEGDFDADTRFCVKWFSTFGWDEADFGNADQLSRSTNTSVERLVRGGIFWARAGKARLLDADDLATGWNPLSDERVSVWEVVLRLAKAVAEQGVEAAAPIFVAAGQRVDLDVAKELAYLLFNISERKGWTQSALLFNSLGSSWLEVEHAAHIRGTGPSAIQGELDYETDDDES